MENALQHSPRPSQGLTVPTAGVNYESRVRLARSSAPIAELTIDKHLHSAILRVVFILGTPKDHYPDTAEIDALKAYIKANQAKHSLQSLVLAFELYIAGRLDIQPKDYIRFSPLLIEQVLQSYTRYAFNLVRQDTETAEEAATNKELETLRNMDEKQRDALIQADICKTFETYRTSGRLFDPGNYMWLWLERKRYANFTRERKEAIKSRTRLVNAESFQRGLCSEMTEDEQLKVASREEALKAFFNDLIESGTEIGDIFNRHPYEDVK